MIVWIIALSSATSVSGLNCRKCVAWRARSPRRGSATISLTPCFGGVLHPGRGHRMVRGRVGADQEHHFGLHHVVHLVGHRARADAFEQRRHRRGVAQARAVVDVVGAEAGAHQLLEQVGLLVASPWPSRSRPARIGPRPGFSVSPPAARSSASSQVASRNTSDQLRRIDDEIARSSATPACGSAAWSAAAGGARSRSRSAPSRTGGRGSPGRRLPVTNWISFCP